MIVISVILFGFYQPAPFAHAMETGDTITQELQKKWTGDYDGMLKRQTIRILIPYSATFFFLDGGVERGLAVEWVEELRKHVNRDVKSKKKQPEIFIIPTARDRLIPDLLAGKGDIVIGNLTITEARKKKIDFSKPFIRNVDEVLVTPKSTAEIDSANGLAGKPVFVRKSSSYFESLAKLNSVLKAKGRKPVRIVTADERLEAEDILEMVNAELIPATIVDNHIAKFWAKIFPDIRIHPKVKIREGAEIAWAMRKNSPKLKKKIDSFADKAGSNTVLGNILTARYYKKTEWVRKATSKANNKKLDELAALFQKYGKRYNIDWLILAGLAFKESRLDPKAKGPTGAVGLMQIKPSTAAGPEVNIKNISGIEDNIHAGTKYLRHLADRYFPGDDVDEFNRILFALASYNAGPERIRKLRKKTKNPNLWFDNVEVTVANNVGQIPVRYVLVIFEYYVAFKLTHEIDKERRILIQQGGTQK